MPGPYSPSDSLVGPIAHEIAVLVAAQIPSISRVYETLPDRPPDDNSVVLAMTRARVRDAETNGKIKITFVFSIRHMFRRTSMSANVTSAYSYLVPWMNMLAAWPNQGLGGLAISVGTTDVMITQMMQSGQPMVALVINAEVLTEFNIPTS